MNYAREKRRSDREREEMDGKWPTGQVRDKQGHRGGEDGGGRRAEGEARPSRRAEGRSAGGQRVQGVLRRACPHISLQEIRIYMSFCFYRTRKRHI